MSRSPASHTERHEGIDLTRGLATALMVQWHGYDAWARAGERGGALGTVVTLAGRFPLAAFLFLAGISLALSLERRRDDLHEIRVKESLVRRGLMLVALGYATNALYCALEWRFDLPTLLRADVLHVIGLSLAVTAGLCIGPATAASARAGSRLRRNALVLGLCATVLCPWLTRVSRHALAPWSYLVAPFVEVEGVTRMPLVPLVAFLCAGTLFARSFQAHHAAGEPTPRRFALWLAVGLLSWGASELATHAMLIWLPGSLSRSHPAIVFNVLAGVCRAICLLSVGCLVAPWLPRCARRVGLLLGRRSLTVYVVHIPFCYGVFGRRYAHQLTNVQAELAVMLLLAGSAFVAFAVERGQRHLASRGA